MVASVALAEVAGMAAAEVMAVWWRRWNCWQCRGGGGLVVAVMALQYIRAVVLVVEVMAVGWRRW